jgi:hypothetical protein
MNIERVKKGAQYFKGLKPSEFVVGAGFPNPTKWKQLQAFLDLILEEPEQLGFVKKVEILNQ